MKFENSLSFAKNLDSIDELSSFSNKFAFPKSKRERTLYFTGHSLGLMPKHLPQIVSEEFTAWSEKGVEAHFLGEHPWLPYHEFLTGSLAKLTGAKNSEVVAMNTLTTNLHLMLVSFYRPKGKRTKILIENNTFPSDRYAVLSQARFHGLDPESTVIELKPSGDGMTVGIDSIKKQIAELGDELALVLLGNCNYLSGEYFPIAEVTKAAHEVGAFCGFNLAHGVGNLELSLHQDLVDFAVWCSYKYLNSGPGGIAGAFVHEKHHGNKSIPRFEGWWGTDKSKRFKMEKHFDPIPSVEAWQLSNPPIFQLAAARASLQLFDQAGIHKLRTKSQKLTGFLAFLIEENLASKLSLITPTSRGSMLCLKLNKGAQKLEKDMVEKGAYVDYREPGIIRVAPMALYTSFSDCFDLVELLDRSL
jgi:kynureninase